MGIQRYLPTTIGTAFTGMKPAVEGGDYVLFTDHAAEVERLTAEVAKHKERRQHFEDLLNDSIRKETEWLRKALDAEAERDAAVAAKERAVEALRFYADRKSYDGHYMMSPLVTQDQGKCARAALSPEPWGGPEGEEDA